jgi:hypothetical protein
MNTTKERNPSIGRVGILLRVLDMHHHRFVSTLGSVYIDAMESEEGGMRKSVE